MYGRYDQSGIEVQEDEMSPFLAALIAKDVVGAQLLVTTHPAALLSRGSYLYI
jgi:hypothetical protein